LTDDATAIQERRSLSREAESEKRVGFSWNELKIRFGEHVCGVPEWALSYLMLGAWGRSFQHSKKRLIVFVVLPTRRLAGVFASLGSLAAGAASFQPQITWPRFRALPPNTVVHWKDARDKKRFSGVVTSFSQEFGTEFIDVDITKPATKAGVTLKVSRGNFEGYSFSLAPRPSNLQADELVTVAEFLRSLTSHVDDGWVQADSNECLLVTNSSALNADIAGLSLEVKGASYTLGEILLVTGAMSNFSKLSVASPIRVDEIESPVVILDGPRAFAAHSNLRGSPNLVIFLDRSEYNESIQNDVLSLKYSSEKIPESCALNAPKSFPLGFDVTAFVTQAD